MLQKSNGWEATRVSWGAHPMFIIDICTSRRGMNGRGDYLANLFSIVSTRKMFSGKRTRGGGCIASSSVIELSKYEMRAPRNTVAR